MPKCPMMVSKRNSVTCDPSGYFGCPKHKNRDQITPECWRLRRLEDKRALDETPKEKLYRSSKLKCPKCKFKFQAKYGMM
jgi:predicted HNH restriction endonuclease